MSEESPAVTTQCPLGRLFGQEWHESRLPLPERERTLNARSRDLVTLEQLIDHFTDRFGRKPFRIRLCPTRLRQIAQEVQIPWQELTEWQGVPLMVDRSVPWNQAYLD